MRTFLVFFGTMLVACGSVVTNTDGGGSDGATMDSSGGGDGSGGGCSPACSMGRTCCNGKCINPDNDPFNCGMCDKKCTGATPHCDAMNGGCIAAPCMPACTGNQICCKDEGPVSAGSMCYTPTTAQPTCPQGCAPLCQSDRNIKHDVTAVDGKDVARTLAGLPMSTWSYNGERTRHIGPMAQDLHSAFGLGNTERAYDPIDAHGLAFAGIQGLYEMVEQQNARIDRLEKENAELERRCKR